MRAYLACALIFIAALSTGVYASEVAPERTVLSVDLAHPGAAISPQMFGIFFEDINFAADGGLYPELVKNRSFEFSEPLTGWHEMLAFDQKGLHASKGEMVIASERPLNPNNPHYLEVRVHEAGGYGFYNTGFRGMGIHAGEDYRFSAWVRTNGPKSLRVAVSDKANAIASGKIEGFTSEWKHFETVIHADATADQARLDLYGDEPGTMDLDMVSLFPVDTWKGRPNGLRKDLVQLLADMHPGFIRFPGGCIVEGRQLLTRYRWKTTVGNLEERKTIVNRWNDEFDKRPAPDYFQSFGLGFFEYFQLAEDIGARPLPILNCGMACQFNTSETAKMSELDEYVQDALDLIEFANGPLTTPWGKLRAQMGHAAPFHLEMIGVGNEQWGDRYVERYKVFADALRSKHPEIKLVAAAGPAPSGEPFESMWTAWRQLHPDFVDEHYYMPPQWFLENTTRYDKYDRRGPKVFAGEYAAQSVGTTSDANRNNWRAAIAEAAFMTGLERNGDVVAMASYAPLLANENAWQWKPDAIWFDNLRSYGTPNFYVQSVYANNAGTRVVPITPLLDDGLYTSAVFDERSHELIVKAINTSANARSTLLRLQGGTAGGAAKVTTLESADLNAENSYEHPKAVAPVESTMTLSGAETSLELKPYSLTVLRIPMK